MLRGNFPSEQQKAFTGFIDFENRVRECGKCRKIKEFQFFATYTSGSPCRICRECELEKKRAYARNERLKKGKHIVCGYKKCATVWKKENSPKYCPACGWPVRD